VVSAVRVFAEDAAELAHVAAHCAASTNAGVRLGVLFGVCQADRSESLLQPRIEAIAPTVKQLVEDRVRQCLELVGMADGSTA
jgi:hypothetical protein